MSEKEYIVSLNKGVDYEAFNQEMIASTGAGDIPSRVVSVANARPASQRNTHYSLTDAEANTLAADGRVYAVELRPDLRDDLVMTRFATQTGDFSKTTLDRGNFINWGLLRSNNAQNTYTGAATTGGYDYTLDGSGVDIVISDSGIQADHPDFYDYNGVSRVQQINWYAESGVAGTQSANHYRDYDGHGTHVAGIAAGLTYGWAKNAKIYALKVNGLEGSGDSGTGIAIVDCFDVIKEWHNNKPNDPSTGVPRPTIVNMSWGYGGYFSGISGGSYRGTPWSGSARDTAKGMVGRFDGAGQRYGTRVASVDVDVEELIAAGVHVCIAAGNTSQKVDVAEGLDYNNYFTKTASGATTFHYNRGGSPYSINAHMVGNIDSTIIADGLEQKATSSETGPGVSVYAPGTNIMSTTSTINKWGTGDGPYPVNDSYLITNISGTSMASPQIAGMLSMYTQLNLTATPSQALSYINTNAKTAKLYDTASTTDYAELRSLLGGNNRFAFNKFNSSTQMRIGQTVEDTALVPASYSLSRSVSSVNEGGSFVLTLTTTNITDGTLVPFTVSGVSADDLSSGTLTGNFTVNSNTATASFTIAEDLATEGAETFTLSLDGVSISVSVSISDTSVALVPTYAIASSSASLNEGDTLTITLTTTNVADATNVPYTISGTGITTADIGGNALTGNFTVTSNTATLALPITSDATTEGGETLTFTLDSLGVTTNVNINDTSQAGGVSYTLSSSAASVNEGSSVTITLTTTNVADATVLPYTISGVSSADISDASLTGNFTVASNAATLALTLASDATTEGAETLVIVLDNGEANTLNVTVNDTSLTPSQSFALAVSSAALNEGESTTFTLTTTNVPDAAIVPYTITGVSSPDLDNGPRTNAAIKPLVGAGSNFFKREVTTNYVRLVVAGAVGGQTAVPDAFVEKVARMFDLFLDEGGSGISLNKQDQVISNLKGLTTSWHPNLPTIQRIARGSGASYTPNFLTDDGIAAWGLSPLFDATVQNDMVWYLNSSGVTGNGDIDAGEVIEHVMHTLHMHGLDAPNLKMYSSISSDWASGPLYNAMVEAFDASMWDPQGYNTPANAFKTVPEAFEVAAKEYLYLLNFCMFEYTDLWDGGSLSPEWSDSMRTPAGILSNNPLGYALHNSYIGDVISKPSLATIRSIFQDGDTGTPTDAGASGYSADAAIPLTADFTVTSNTATLKLNIAPDVGTEGDETLTLALNNGEASQNVTINDTSVTPAASYSLSSSAASVNEGAVVTITLVTTGVSDAINVPYTISGVSSADISGASLTGNMTISSSTASVALTIATDATTEGVETLLLALDNGAATQQVTINDTSVAASADYTINAVHSGSSAYTLSGTDRNGSVSGNNAGLAFNTGDVVDFVVNASGHPFYVKTANVTGTGSVAPGVTNNGTQSGTVRWTVGSTGTFYYICQFHSAMNGTITVAS
jgi:plastocyanin